MLLPKFELQPLQMFCCGCKLSTGAYAVLACHLLLCCTYVGLATASLISGTVAITDYMSPPEQLANCALGLVGIPAIICGMYGLMARLEINVRLYLYYLLMTFVLDCVRLVYMFLLRDFCGQSYSEASKVFGSLDKILGDAFLCGIVRIASYVIVGGIILLEAYCLMIIWSVCEDMHLGQWGPELAALLPNKADMITKWRRPHDGPYADIVGFAHAKVPGPYPSLGGYEAISTIGMPNQGTIFGGTRHETKYPPSTETAVF
jgi:hypothetical protein